MDTSLLEPLGLEVKDAVKDILFKHVTNGKTNDMPPDVIFMAGSPAAGKTELLNRLIELHGLEDFVRVDADDFRWWFPYYNEENSLFFQKPASKMVSYIYKECLKNKYRTIMDSTFSSKGIAEQNFDAAIKAGYEIFLHYVYLDPATAWEYAQTRKRTVTIEILKKNFIEGRKVIEHILDKYDGQFTLTVHHRFRDVSKPFGFGIDTIEDVTKHTWAASHPCPYTCIEDLAHIGV
ncbi:zeta toxin family protein [Pantoea dispersa]|uniref:zeta toxin family protein n=1 Tax=Pantoea dispersa TaxID=59814 RepID=UPI0028DF098B|nr:zeta toxin family protein [Pantoea dispersa]MDT8850237.1 zeta toxin family protein [Pantoea dispersa]